MNMCLRISVICLMVMLFCPGRGQAEAQSAGKPIPTNITSQAVLFDQNSDVVTFTGDVVVVRQDMTITSETLLVYLVDQKNKSASSASEENGTVARSTKAIDRIVAKGNVHIEQLNREGVCETATYLSKENTVTMEGNPMLLEKDTKNQITGETIIFNMTTNQSRILSGKNKKVEAIFYSTEEGQ